MKYAINIIATFFIILYYFFSADLANADIIQKEPYITNPSTKYKEDLNVAILPLSGELSEERKYVIELIKNYISDKIFAYKKIRFVPSAIDFKKYGFDSSGKESETSNDSLNGTYNDQFLILQPVNDKIINTVKIKISPESSKLFAVPGIDILITGTLIQNKNNIKVNIKVFNYIYAKVFFIERENSFKNIEQLMDEISYEAIKSIIAYHSLLSISCNEKDAYIYIDDRYFGRTDKKDILLESGNHKIDISKENLARKEIQINIAENTSEKLHVDLIRESVQAKSVKITTIPDKARVYLDSDFIGLSPAAKSDLNDGMCRIRIEKEGYITKYITVDPGKEKDRNKEISVTLEKGDSNEYYFSRTSVYNTLFKCSFFGMALSTASYIYFGLKENDEDAKLNALSLPDSDYQSKKNKIEKQKDKFTLYKQISLYTLGAMIISAGIFYYLDITQDDIAVALYIPQSNNPAGNISFFNSASGLSANKSIGIFVSKSF